MAILYVAVLAHSACAQPAVMSLEPRTGPAAGGTAVTITGMSFEPGVTVRFGQATAASVEVISGNQLKCVTPPAATRGPCAVTVTGAAGSSAPADEPFTYAGAPGSVAPPPAAEPPAETPASVPPEAPSARVRSRRGPPARVKTSAAPVRDPGREALAGMIPDYDALEARLLETARACGFRACAAEMRAELHDIWRTQVFQDVEDRFRAVVRKTMDAPPARPVDLQDPQDKKARAKLLRGDRWEYFPKKEGLPPPSPDVKECWVKRTTMSSHYAGATVGAGTVTHSYLRSEGAEWRRYSWDGEAGEWTLCTTSEKRATEANFRKGIAAELAALPGEPAAPDDRLLAEARKYAQHWSLEPGCTRIIRAHATEVQRRALQAFRDGPRPVWPDDKWKPATHGRRGRAPGRAPATPAR